MCYCAYLYFHLHTEPTGNRTSVKDWNAKGASNTHSLFSAKQLPPCIFLTADHRRANYTGGNMTPFVRVFCETPVNTFKVKIIRSLSEHLHVGMCLPFSPTPLRFNAHAWFLCRADSQLFERGKYGPASVTRFGVGAVVSVEKDPDPSQCALRFRLDGKELVDINGEPFGWRPTGLSADEFNALVGVVEFQSQSVGDEVLIVD